MSYPRAGDCVLLAGRKPSPSTVGVLIARHASGMWQISFDDGSRGEFREDLYGGKAEFVPWRQDGGRRYRKGGARKPDL